MMACVAMWRVPSAARTLSSFFPCGRLQGGAYLFVDSFLVPNQHVQLNVCPHGNRMSVWCQRTGGTLSAANGLFLFASKAHVHKVGEHPGQKAVRRHSCTQEQTLPYCKFLSAPEEVKPIHTLGDFLLPLEDLENIPPPSQPDSQLCLPKCTFIQAWAILGWC